MNEVTVHGGPWHGRVVEVAPDMRYLDVVVPSVAKASYHPDWDPLPITFNVFRYVVSRERWPVPPDGGRWIAYPAVTP